MVKISMRQISSLLGGSPNRRAQADDQKQYRSPQHGDGGQTREELSVDEAIAIDRLREHAAQCATGIFAADRIEAQGDADQGPKKPRKLAREKSIHHSK